MKRRTLFLSAAAALVAAPASAAPIPLDRISAYFNGLTTLEARFTQFNGDGSRSSGTFYIRRPGRARFEYDPPDSALVMAGGGQLAIFDSRSNSAAPEQYPLDRTPLNVVLERTVDLAQRDSIVDHRGTSDATVVVAQDPQHPEYGWIELIFADAPLRLVEWTVVDASGTSTRVVLEALRTGHDLSARLFNIPQEVANRTGTGNR